ncbi:MAG: hypothetical protein ACK5S8_18375 [Pseudanabaena sp.]
MSLTVIPDRKARQGYLFSVTTQRSKMICLVAEFREGIGDSFQDASCRKDR